MLTIKSHQDFERVFTQGRRVNHPLIRMVICDCASEGDPARVAFAAAKRLGNAVVRNRSKRVLREAARACGLPLEGKEVILFATPRTRTASPGEMNDALRGLLARAGVGGYEKFAVRRPRRSHEGSCAAEAHHARSSAGSLSPNPSTPVLPSGQEL